MRARLHGGDVAEAIVLGGRHELVAEAGLQQRGDAAEAEIRHLDDPVARGHLRHSAWAGVDAPDQQVRRLQVPVDHARAAVRAQASASDSHSVSSFDLVWPITSRAEI